MVQSMNPRTKFMSAEPLIIKRSIFLFNYLNNLHNIEQQRCCGFIGHYCNTGVCAFVQLADVVV